MSAADTIRAIADQMANGPFEGDWKAGFDLVFEIIDDDPDEPLDQSPLDETDRVACEEFIFELGDIARLLEDMLWQRTGQRHRCGGEVGGEALCRACLREADYRASIDDPEAAQHEAAVQAFLAEHDPEYAAE